MKNLFICLLLLFTAYTAQAQDDYYKVGHRMNYCMVHENIPDHLLPMLYYYGDGDYMILATKK